MSTQIHCPKCGYEFEASAGIREHLELELREQLRAEHDRHLSDQARSAEERLLEKERELRDARHEAAEASAKETEFLKKERELEARERQSALDLEKTLAEETHRIRSIEAKAAEERVERLTEERLRSKNEELAEAQAKAADASKREAELLRKQREVEERERHLSLELERKLDTETQRIRATEVKAAEERVSRLVQEQMRPKEEELAQARAQASEARAKEAELLRMRRELEDRESRLALDAEQQLAAEIERIQAEAARAAEERAALRVGEALRAKNEELALAKKTVSGVAAREVELLRKQRELEGREQELALKAEQKLAEESKRIREQARADADERLRFEREQRRLEGEEHQQQNAALQKQLEDVQQRVRQGSQQAQGEAQETVLAELLTNLFPEDSVEEVPKGVRGADLIERVHGPGGSEHGTIVWESKRTKAWSDEWLSKLRDDQRAIGAECAVIVSQALPPDVRHFEFRDGVWVCAWSCAAALAAALRHHLIEVTRARLVSHGREDKMRMMYEYLTGPEFRNRVSGLVEAFCEMEEDLTRERRAMEGIWKKREKQILRARTGIGGFYGELQGIAGRQIANLPELSLDAIAMLGPGDSDSDEGAPVSEPAASSGAPTDGRLVDALYALLPADCTFVGNTTMRDRFAEVAFTRFGVADGDAEYDRCKSLLLDRGAIRKGKGRGGSVARAMPVAAE